MIYLDYFCDLLKKRFLQTGFISESDFIENDEFCLKNLEKNFFEPMSEETKKNYLDGDGDELGRKDKTKKANMSAVRSSSAMIYNLLGNNDVIFKENAIIPAGIYKKEYELKHETITYRYKRNPTRANLDAYLHNENNEIFIEAKCMEWIENWTRHELKNAYLEEKFYFDKSTFPIFESAGKRISCSQYDSVQMFRHTLAIYNYLREKKIAGKKALLLNVVWELPAEEIPEKARKRYTHQLALEHLEFEYFHEQMQPVINIFKEHTGCDFDIKYISVADFCKMIDYKDEKQLKFIQRY